MSFDEDPDDAYEHYQCDCGGSIKLNIDKTKWECDVCNFERENLKSKNGRGRD